MMTWTAISVFFCLAIFLDEPEVAEGRRPHFGHCAVAVDIKEVMRHFEVIKHEVQKQDKRTDVMLFDIHLLNDIKIKERCCFMRELLRFYVHNVFKPLETTHTHIKMGISHLANTFKEMKAQLIHCHKHGKCLCEDEAKNMDIIRDNFEKLDTKTAISKAIAELDILLPWIESHIPVGGRS